MLWVKNVNGEYLYANKALCDGLLIAQDIEEPIGKDDVFFALREREAHKDRTDWHTFGELCFNSDKEVIKQNKPMRFEEFGNVKGKMLYLEVYKAPFYDDAGEIAGTVGAGRDITEMKNMELKLKENLISLKKHEKELKEFNELLEERVQSEMQKQKKQEKIMIHQSRQVAMGEMLEMIAHQWRQPLNIIGLTTASIETQTMLGKGCQEFDEKIKLIADNVTYMSDAIDTFRKFLNPNIEKKSFLPNTVLEEVLQMFSSQLKQYNIEYIYTSDNKKLLEVNENEFKQVLLIVINNAIDAIKNAITEKKIEKGKITIELKNKKKHVVLKIQDNGGGISDTHIDSIFEPYFTTKKIANGSGIGLYIARNIIQERMSGEIKAENISDGACFTIILK